MCLSDGMQRKSDRILRIWPKCNRLRCGKCNRCQLGPARCPKNLVSLPSHLLPLIAYLRSAPAVCVRRDIDTAEALSLVADPWSFSNICAAQSAAVDSFSTDSSRKSSPGFPAVFTAWQGSPRVSHGATIPVACAYKIHMLFLAVYC